MRDKASIGPTLIIREPDFGFRDADLLQIAALPLFCGRWERKEVERAPTCKSRAKFGFTRLGGVSFLKGVSNGTYQSIGRRRLHRDGRPVA